MIAETVESFNSKTLVTLQCSLRTKFESINLPGESTFIFQMTSVLLFLFLQEWTLCLYEFAAPLYEYMHTTFPQFLSQTTNCCSCQILLPSYMVQKCVEEVTSNVYTSCKVISMYNTVVNHVWPFQYLYDIFNCTCMCELRYM